MNANFVVIFFVVDFAIFLGEIGIDDGYPEDLVTLGVKLNRRADSRGTEEWGRRVFAKEASIWRMTP